MHTSRNEHPGQPPALRPSQQQPREGFGCAPHDQPTSSPADMQTALDDLEALEAPVRTAKGPVKAEAKSQATRASVQAAKVFILWVGRWVSV